MGHPLLRRCGALTAAILLAAVPAPVLRAQDRADCNAYSSKILRRGVRYCVYLPASYAASKTERYPVLYLLHGLGGNEQEIALSGEWSQVRDLRQAGKIGEFLIVAPDGGRSFYINSEDGRRPYSDFFLREFVPFIERTYRIRAGRASRGITGFSMGAYGALRFAFADPEQFGSVSAHSAALMKDPPQALTDGAGVGNPAAQLLQNVFGNPIDRPFWSRNSVFVLARANANLLRKSKIYFDCGTEDNYGFDRGAADLHQELDALKIVHEFHLFPGGHNLDYLLAHADASLEFHWRVFSSAR